MVSFFCALVACGLACRWVLRLLWRFLRCRGFVTERVAAGIGEALEAGVGEEFEARGVESFEAMVSEKPLEAVVGEKPFEAWILG
jgi:hypothetical protein